MNWKVLPRPQMMPAQKAMSLLTPQSLRYAVKLDLGAPKMGLYRKMTLRKKDRAASAQKTYMRSLHTQATPHQQYTWLTGNSGLVIQQSGRQYSRCSVIA